MTRPYSLAQKFRLRRSVRLALARFALPDRVVITSRDRVVRRLALERNQLPNGLRDRAADITVFVVKRVDALADAVHHARLFEVADGVRPDEESEALGDTELGPALSQPEEAFLDRAHRRHELEHRPLFAGRSSVDDHSLGKQPEADREDIALIDDLAQLLEVDSDAVFSKPSLAPYQGRFYPP